LEARKTIFTIGATNRPDIIDPAITRPGRLDQLIYIPLPDEPARLSIFKAKMRKIACSPDVNFQALAHATEGFSGADIAEICNRASRYAIKLSLSEHVRREKLREEAIENGTEPPPEDDSIYTITQQHFNFALQTARKSVSEADIARYRHYAETMQHARSIGGVSQLPSMPVNNPPPSQTNNANFSNSANNDDDLFN